MSNAKHTPGPWIVASDGHYPVIRKQFHAGHHMNVCGPVHGYMYASEKFGITEDENQKANVRLIAAAPELLDALELAALYLNDLVADGKANGHEVNGIATDCRNAIAKAKGETQ